MSLENPLWGAPKIHGELLKLGIEVAQSTVSIYMVPRPDRPLQTWKTFLRNHMEGIASIDLFVVPTIGFEPLFAFLVLGHRRRQLRWFAVTHNPTAEWLARQITEAFPWDSAPKYLIRDNDRAFGATFKARVRAMGIRDRPTSTTTVETAIDPAQWVSVFGRAGTDPLAAAGWTQALINLSGVGVTFGGVTSRHIN
jgi:hypothetical protein